MMSICDYMININISPYTYHIDQYTRSSKDTFVEIFPYDTYLDHHTIDVEIYIYKPNDYGQIKNIP